MDTSNTSLLDFSRIRAQIDERTIKYSLRTDSGNGNHQPAPFLTFLERLASKDEKFTNEFIGLLRDAPFPAVFFECIPVTRATLGTLPFEFVLVEAGELEKVKQADLSAFADYFTPSEADSVVSFLNLGRDAWLVVPCILAGKEKSPNDYAHLTTFVRSSVISDRQKLNLFQRLGEVALATLNAPDRPPGEKLWMSTSGLGIYWLHLRLDKRPKYYNYLPYKT